MDYKMHDVQHNNLLQVFSQKSYQENIVPNLIIQITLFNFILHKITFLILVVVTSKVPMFYVVLINFIISSFKFLNEISETDLT